MIIFDEEEQSPDAAQYRQNPGSMCIFAAGSHRDLEVADACGRCLLGRPPTEVTTASHDG